MATWPPDNAITKKATAKRRAPMTAVEARVITDLIKASTQELWDHLLEANEGRAWKPLGYRNWREYASAEFNMSEARAYQLLDQGKIIRAIEEVVGISTLVEISERDARDIKPHLTAVTDEISTRVEGGEQPEVVVTEVVARTRQAATAGRLGTRVRRAPDVAKVLPKLITGLRGMNLTLEILDVTQPLTDTECVDEWLSEIDKTIRALRALRSQLKGASQ